MTTYTAALARLDALSALEAAALHRVTTARANHASATASARHHHRATLPHPLNTGAVMPRVLAAAATSVPLQQAEHELAAAERAHAQIGDERARVTATLSSLRKAAA